MGTPVEIIYDRVIMEEAPDHTVSYYIYPDGYGWEPLTVSSVKEYLARYGVEDFATPDEVYHKIIASDGSVTYVAKHYDLVINGRKLKRRLSVKMEVSGSLQWKRLSPPRWGLTGTGKQTH